MEEDLFDKYMEEYIFSDYDKNHLIAVGANEEQITIIQSTIHEIQEKYEFYTGDNHFHDYFKSFVLACLEEYKKKEINDNIFLLSKINSLLSSEILSSTIISYWMYVNKDELYRDLTEEENALLDKRSDLYLSMCIIMGPYTFLQLFYPDLYTYEEQQELKDKLSIVKNREEYSRILNEYTDIFSSRIKNEYGSYREFKKVIKDKLLTKKQTISDENITNNNIKKTINETYKFFSIINNLVTKQKCEYDSWKYQSLFSQYVSTDICKTIVFFIYNFTIEENLLKYFFHALNQNRFQIRQIDYIKEMAPKLRIASYLNEEYKNHIKKYNLNSHDFNFGVDDQEEPELLLLESPKAQLLLENNPMAEEADIEDEKKEKLHLGPLSRFTKEQLIELLKKFRDRKEPFVHKETKQNNWLFVFGMKSDTPPKGFEKIKWEAKYNGRPAKGALIDFLELLGYDINQLYEVDSIKILNECFECYNPDNKLVPIDQNDFHYKKKTKEREHSKMFYNIFKEIIEGIEKQP